MKATQKQIAALAAGKPPPMTEDEFQRVVIQLAKAHKWRVAHFRPARTAKGWRTAVSGDGAGFPDLILTRGPRLIAAELKSATGQASQEQLEWLAAFRECGAEAYLWRPSHWLLIEELLK